MSTAYMAALVNKQEFYNGDALSQYSVNHILGYSKGKLNLTRGGGVLLKLSLNNKNYKQNRIVTSKESERYIHLLSNSRYI